MPRSAEAQVASDRVLHSVEGQLGKAGWKLRLRFTVPLRYVRHSPRDATNLGLIELEPVGIGRADRTTPTKREALRPFEAGAGPPVVEVATEAALTGRRVVEIRFRKPVVFQVSQGSELRELVVTFPAEGTSRDERRARSLLAAAEEAMRAGDHDRAIQLYTKVLSIDAPQTHPEARERLGLARERNGQRAHARAEYERYLELYPEGPAAARVRQRLQALSTADEPLPQDRTQPRRPLARVRDRFDVHGSLSSFYSRGEIFLDRGFDDQVVDNSWTTDLFLTSRFREEAYEFEASGSGRTRLDFDDGEIANDSRLSSLLLEGSQRGLGFWGNLGRQRGVGGVIGRFDGGRLGYRPTDWLDVHILGGFPLDNYSSNSLNTDRFQVGAVGKVLEVFDLVDLQLYTNYQNEDGLTYRAAIGGEIRHLRANRSLVLSLDYDAYFNALNIASFLADVEVSPGLRLNTLLEYRRSPILTLGNARIGQRVGSIESLRDLFSDSEIKDLAEDRTAYASTFSLGARYELTDRFDLLGTWTASRLSGTHTSGGVIGSESPGFQYAYYAQVSGRSLLMDRGVTTGAIRIFDGDRFDGYMLQLNGRYPVWQKLRLNPIFRLEFQDRSERSDLVRVVPRIRLDYTWGPVVLDLDFAFDVTRDIEENDQPNEYGYSLVFGLRYDF